MAVLFSDDFSGGDLSNWDSDPTNPLTPTPTGDVSVDAGHLRAAYDGTDFGMISKHVGVGAACFYYQYDLYLSQAYLDAVLYYANHSGGAAGPTPQTGDIFNADPFLQGFSSYSTGGTPGALTGPFNWAPVFSGDTQNVIEIVPDDWHTLRAEFDEVGLTMFVDGEVLATFDNVSSDIGDQISAYGFQFGSILAVAQNVSGPPEPVLIDNIEIGTIDGCGGGGGGTPGPGIHAWQRL